MNKQEIKKNMSINWSQYVRIEEVVEALVLEDAEALTKIASIMQRCKAHNASMIATIDSATDRDAESVAKAFKYPEEKDV